MCHPSPWLQLIYRTSIFWRQILYRKSLISSLGVSIAIHVPPLSSFPPCSRTPPCDVNRVHTYKEEVEERDLLSPSPIPYPRHGKTRKKRKRCRKQAPPRGV